MNKQDWDLKIKELVKGYDLKDESERGKALMACLNYARDEIKDRDQANAFLQYAQKQLGVETGIRFDYLRDKYETENAKIHVCLVGDNNKVEITANAEGWVHLAKVCEELSRAVEHEHAQYFYGETPLTQSSLNLILYKELDSWFQNK